MCGGIGYGGHCSSPWCSSWCSSCGGEGVEVVGLGMAAIALVHGVPAVVVRE